MLEADASGIEAKANALKKYNEAATFIELAKMHIEAERDIHIDQAKAMGSALSQAQIRMYGGDNDGTIASIRGLFTKGFGLGEALEGIAQSLPQGLRDRFAQNGLRGIFGKPAVNGSLKESVGQLGELITRSLKPKQVKELPFPEGLNLLESSVGDDATLGQAVSLLREVNQHGLFNDVSFEKVWALVQAAAKSAG
jgi:hypothetical protein